MTGPKSVVFPRQCALRVEGVYDWFQTGSPVVDLDVDPVDGLYPRAVLGWIDANMDWTERPRVQVHYEHSDIYRPGYAHPNHYGLNLDSSTGMLHLREWFRRRFGAKGSQRALCMDMEHSPYASSLPWALRTNAIRMLAGKPEYKQFVHPWGEGWAGLCREGSDVLIALTDSGWRITFANGSWYSGPETGEVGQLEADKAAHERGIWCVGYSEEQEP